MTNSNVHCAISLLLDNRHTLHQSYQVDIMINSSRGLCVVVPHASFGCSFPQKDEVYLNLVLEYVPETVYRVARHYSKNKQTIPVLYIKVSLILVQRDPFWKSYHIIVTRYRNISLPQKLIQNRVFQRFYPGVPISCSIC